MEQNQMYPACRCMHHKMIPIYLILLGLAFLLQNLYVVSAYYMGMVWPVIVILIGFQKLLQGRCTCCNRDK